MAKKPKARKLVFAFTEANGQDRKVLGGKGAGLAAMTQMGLPVPPGFIVSTGACRAYLEHGVKPVRLDWQVRHAIRQLEQRTGKRFGARRNPLLISVRSGAPNSMPGMMDTILNLGITSQSMPALKTLYGVSIAEALLDRFQAGFTTITGSDAPDDAVEQLDLAIEAVWHSWLNNRAIAYREAHGIPHSLGTAVVCQQMVFGLGSNSGTGVAFSRNVTSGDPQIFGEYLPDAQGEDVVSGKRDPLPLAALADEMPEVYEALSRSVQTLEGVHRDVVDVEFTVDAGKLWLLQVRPAKRTPQAKARFAVQAVWAKQQSKEQALADFTEGDIETLGRPKFDSRAVDEAVSNGLVLARGLAVAPGAAIGQAVFSSERAVQVAQKGEKPVLIRPDTKPDDLPGMLKSVAVVTAVGGATCHAAVVARSLGIPAIVGVGQFLPINEDDFVSVDGDQGLLLRGQLPFAAATHQKEVNILLKWVQLHRPELFAMKIEPDFTALARRESVNRLVNDFYLADGMQTAAVGTALQVEASALARAVTQDTATFLLTYLIVAVSGEIRYAAKYDIKSVRALMERYRIASITDRYEGQDAVLEILKKCSLEQILEFLSLAEEAFDADVWGSGTSVGGKRWGQIARAARMVLSRELKPTVFVDHAFDLQHNTGRVFNKHSMVTQLTSSTSLEHQLNLKKSAPSLRDLWVWLTSAYSSLSPEVDALWKKGLALGIWGTNKAAA